MSIRYRPRATGNRKESHDNRRRFDVIQKEQSVLVLSDKKEALDVVEEKITDTLNKVRHDKHFQNPILRLGRTGSTYSKILSASQ